MTVTLTALIEIRDSLRLAQNALAEAVYTPDGTVNAIRTAGAHAQHAALLVTRFIATHGGVHARG